MSRIFSNPVVATAVEAVGVAMTLVLGLCTFGALLYANGHRGWGLTLFVIGSVLAIIVLVGVGFVPARAVIRTLKRVRVVLLSDEPPEHQPLLDIAAEHTQHPQVRLLILKTEFIDKRLDPEEYRPWVEIGLAMRNANICDIQVAKAEGRLVYKGKELPDAVESSGHSNKPPDHQHVYRLKQYLPQELARDVMQEFLNERRRSYAFGFSGIKIELTADGAKHWRPLSDVTYVDVPD